jgi:hypothetical protein
MRKLLVCAVMLAVVVVFSAPTNPTALAQEKKGKETGKATKGGFGVIEIRQSEKDEKFRFFVLDAEGKTLAMSVGAGFVTEKDAMAAVDHLKEAISRAKVTMKKAAKDKKEKKK